MHIKRIGILITGECNLHCLHCLQNLREKIHLDSSVICKILQEAKEFGVEQVILSGGEPTVHPHILRIIESIKDMGMIYRMNTNGQNVKVLLQVCSILPPVHFTVSLEGASQDSNDAIRGPGTFSKAVLALKLMSSLGQKTRIQSVLTKSMISEIPAMIQLALNLEVESLVFAVPMPTDRLIRMGLLPSIREIQPAISKIAAIREQYSNKFRIGVHGILPKHRSPSVFEICDNLRMGELSVDWHGNLVLCCQLAGYGQNEKEVVGNLVAESLEHCLLSLRNRIVAMQSHYDSVVSQNRTAYPMACLRCARALDKVQGPESFYLGFE